MKCINLKVSNFFLGTILFLSSFLAFLYVLKTGFFCWDDHAVVLNPSNTHIALKNIILLFNTYQAGLFHPVTSFSFMIDHAAGNGNPVVFHLTNMLLHSMNTLLLFILLRRLTNHQLVAFVAALLWGVHPIHVESVAWITSRKDLLYTFFYFLSLLFYLEFVKNRSTRKYYVLSVVCFLLSSLSKLQAVTLPLILIYMDVFFLRKFNLKTILEKVPFFLLCIPVVLMNYMAQQQYGYIAYGYSFSVFEKGFLILYAMAEYLVKIIYPYPLSIFYPYPFKPGSTPHPYEIIVVGAFVSLLAVIFAFRRKIPKTVWFGIVFFLINAALVAFVSLNRESVIADRYAYLSSAGILLILASFPGNSGTFIEKHKKYAYSLLFLYAGFLSITSVYRTLLWKNQENLFQSALIHFPKSEIILNTLATFGIEQGNFGEAREHLDQAIAFSPDYAQAFYNRGILNTKTGDLNQAITDFTAAIRLNPHYTDAFFARGTAYMKSNQWSLAENDFSNVLTGHPDHFGALQNRAIVRGNIGDFQGALQDLNAAVRIDPTVPSTFYLRGIALFELGLDGCDDLQKALDMGYVKSKEAIRHYCR